MSSTLISFLTVPGIFIALIIFWIFTGIRVIVEYERGIVFRLGRMVGVKQAGLRWLVPFIDKMVKVDMRTVAMDVPPQDIITKDNVSLKVNAVLYFRVLDPERAVIQVEDYYYATSQLAQTTLRSVMGEYELDSVLSEREAINEALQTILDRQTDAWGIKVSSVEVKHVDLPEEMQRAMAKQAEAERERRAKVIHAEGEFQAARKLSDASGIISESPAALQLRFLQTVTEVASKNQNSTTILPVPIDVLSLFLDKKVKKND